MNTRTLVSLDQDDKAWLDEQAVQRAQPMTRMVQEAVAEYRVRQESRGGEPLAMLLERTAGLFARRGIPLEDGLAVQQRLRGEWGGGLRAAKGSRR